METTFNGREENASPWNSAVTQRVCVLQIPSDDLQGSKKKSGQQNFGFAIRGPWVTAVTPGSLAWSSGMREGQKILFIEGESVKGEGTKQILHRIRRYGRDKLTLLVEDPVESADVIIDLDSYDEDSVDQVCLEPRNMVNGMYSTSRQSTMDRKSEAHAPNGAAVPYPRIGPISKTPPPYGFAPNILPSQEDPVGLPPSQHGKHPQAVYAFNSPVITNTPNLYRPNSGEPFFTSTPKPYPTPSEAHTGMSPRDTVVTSAPGPAAVRVNLPRHPDPPNTYLLFTALVTAFCFPFIGGIALYKSRRAKTAFQLGRWKEGENARNQALLIGVVALVIGISIWSMSICVIWVRSIWTEGI